MLQKLLDVFTVGCNELGRLSDSSCSTGKTHIDEYAKTVISEPIPKEHFGLFLKECEWRFNNPSQKAQLLHIKRWLAEYLN